MFATPLKNLSNKNKHFYKKDNEILKLQFLVVDMSFRRSSNIKDRHRAAGLKESYNFGNWKNRERKQMLSALETRQTKLKQYGTRIIRKEKVQNLRSPLLLVC